MRSLQARTTRRSLALAVALATLIACSPPPPARPAASEAPAQTTTAAPRSPAPTSQPAAAAQPAGGSQAPATCKVGQLYTSPTSDKGWSWSHEQSFFAIKKALPYVDLSIRKDSVPDDNQQAVEDIVENMAQQGVKVIYTTSFGFMEPTRKVAARHPDIAFFHASGFTSPSDPPNIGYYFATIEEGRYITGEVAGLTVDPGANVGYVAAHPIPEVFRGENAFALGLAQTNPTAKVNNRWTLTWFDLKLEKEAAESLLEQPVRAQLLTMHQDSPATMLAAQAAGKWGIAYHADMNDVAPKAVLTAATWNWTVHNRPTVEAACSGKWLQGGKVVIPKEYRDWMGSMRDGSVGLAPLNTAALASHPRRAEIEKLYNDEIAKFRSGERSFEKIFTGPIKDNTGQVRIAGKPDIGKLYDENGTWFVENVVGSPKP